MSDWREVDFWDQFVRHPERQPVPLTADERVITEIEALLPDPHAPAVQARAKQRVLSAGRAGAVAPPILPTVAPVTFPVSPPGRHAVSANPLTRHWAAIAAALLLMLGSLSFWVRLEGSPSGTGRENGAVIPAVSDRFGNVPLLGVNPGRTNVVPGPGLVDNPKILWSYTVRKPVRTAPLMVDGIVYFGISSPSPADPGEVVAVTASEGTQLWSYPTAAGLTAAFAVDGQTLFVLDDRQQLYALDTETGKERWQISLRDDPAYSFAYLGALNVSDGKLIVSSGSTMSVAASGKAVFVGIPSPDWIEGDPRVTAISTFDGSVLWDVPAYPDHSSGGLLALSMNDGTVLWNHAGAPARLGPTFLDGVVYYGETGPSTLVALDASTGETRWRTIVSEAVVWDGIASPAVTANLVLAGLTTGDLLAVNRATGTPAWSTHLFAAGIFHNSLSAVGVTGNVAIALAYGGISAVDLTNHTPLWHLQVDVDYTSPPVLLPNRVLQVASEPSSEENIVVMFQPPPESP